MISERVASLFSCAYHVCEVVHAQAVGLDALIGHDVVHEHQSAVGEPDFLALSLL